MCGVPVLNATAMNRQLAKQDSLYKAYVGRIRPLKAESGFPNWRSMMGPVENQGNDWCDADCFDHSASGVLEGQLHISMGSNIGININEDTLAHHTTGCAFREGHFPSEVLSYIQTNKAVSSIGSYPNLQGVRWGINQWELYDGGIQDIKNALVNGPVTASFNIYLDFRTFFNIPANRTAVYHQTTDKIDGAHAVVIVGYDDSDPNNSYWLCKNSWGSEWADNGYFRIGFGECLIDTWENCGVSVGQSCYAKIVPDLIPSLVTACNYGFASNEWAQVLSSLTISSGQTLTVPSGAYITFASGTDLVSYGLLNANGTSNSPVTFTSSSGGIWGAIVMIGSGANGSSLSYCNIHYASEIAASSASNVTIQNCSFDNISIYPIYFNLSTGSILSNTVNSTTTYHGIVLENGSTVTCKLNTITKSGSGYHSGAGILFSSSTGYVWQNDISGWNWGVGAIGSSPQFRDDANNGRNNRIRNCLYGVNAFSNSWPTICPYPGATGFSKYTGNSIYSNSPDCVYFTSGGTLYAEFTYWGSSPAFYAPSGSTIDYSNSLSTDPWAGYGAAPSFGLTANQSVPESELVSPTPGVTIWDGIDLRSQGKFVEAKDLFLSYIAKNPSDQAAFVELFNCYSKETASDIISFFESLPSAASNEQKLLLSILYLKNGNVDKANQYNNSLIAAYPNSSIAAKAKLNNFNIALFQRNDPQAAASILADVSSRSDLTTPVELSLARDALRAYPSALTAQPGTEIQQNPIEEVVQSDLRLSSYPNPFNPSTQIRYAVKQAGLVSLRICDLLGREIATLVNEVKTPGTYNVDWNASRFASGIYFVRFETAGRIAMHKILYLK